MAQTLAFDISWASDIQDNSLSQMLSCADDHKRPSCAVHKLGALKHMLNS